jgi:excinuclease UvrABC nuclease subunit
MEMVRVSGIFVNMNLPGIEELPFVETNYKTNYTGFIPDEQGVYFFLNYDGEVVYVGETMNIKKRIKDHNIFWDHRKEIISVSWLVLPQGHEVERFILEKAYIMYYKPKLNTEIRKNGGP